MAFLTILLTISVVVATASAQGAFAHAQAGNGFGNQFLPLPGFQFPSFPSPQSIANVQPAPGQNWHSIAVKSSSGYSTDKDGNVIRTGGTAVKTNENGDVKEYTVGDAPPSFDDPPIAIPTFQFIPMPTFLPLPPLPTFQPFVFPPIRKPTPPIPPTPPRRPTPPKPPTPPVDPMTMAAYKPKDGENFVSVSTSSFSHTSNVNGVVTGGGGADMVVNKNGEVESDSIRFGQDNQNNSEENQNDSDNETERK